MLFLFIYLPYMDAFSTRLEVVNIVYVCILQMQGIIQKHISEPQLDPFYLCILRNLSYF